MQGPPKQPVGALRAGHARCVQPALDPDAEEEQRRDEQRPRADGEDDARVSNRDEDAGKERSDKRSEALDRGGRPVRADQLFGRSCERRQQRLLRWPHERRSEPDDGCQSEDRRSVLANEEDNRGGGKRRGTDERDRDEEPLTPETVAERSSEGSDERRGQHADEPGDSHRDRSTCVVGEDAERDEVRPLGRDRRAPRKLETPKIVVAKDGNQAGEGLNGAVQAAIESQRPAADKTREVSSPRECGDCQQAPGNGFEVGMIIAILNTDGGTIPENCEG